MTDDAVADYARDGVVCLRGIFDAGWCRTLHDASLDAMASGQGRVREPKLGEGQGRFYSSVYQSDLDPRFGRYAAGSHRWNRMFRAVTPDYDPRFLDESLEVCPDYGDGSHPDLHILSWDMQPGDVLCHHPLTVHGAAGNASATTTRIGLSIRSRGEFPGDDVALSPVWNRERGLLALAR